MASIPATIYVCAVIWYSETATLASIAAEDTQKTAALIVGLYKSSEWRQTIRIETELLTRIRMSKILWTQKTVNPIGGCDRQPVSAGCRNCYARRMARRQEAMGCKRYKSLTDANGWTGKTFWHPEALKAFNTKKPTEFFVVSMGDMYAKSVKQEWIMETFQAMGHNPQHKYLILTKRYWSMWLDLYNVADDCENVFPGFSVCNQQDFDSAERTTERMIEARWKIWLSCEPLLGPIDLKGLPVAGVVCGGENGPGARIMRGEWVRSLRDQCGEMGIPFFFKGWGSVQKRLAQEHISKGGEVLDGAHPRLLGGKTHNDLPWRMTS